jgi:2-keto-4-pentenoate hydratase/2-oxohepta-3-ene-1,7-dioic acid hydratase in catechol pathway
MRQLLEEFELGGFDRAKAAATSGKWRVALGAVRVCAPIYDPEKIICVGMNYYDHCTEQNFPIPKEPVIFSKFASSIVGPDSPVPLEDAETSELDFEVELCVVVGRAGRRIAKEDALEHIAGWTVAHDVSARDWQLKRNGGQWLLGKTMDGFAPIGPSIVTRDEGPEFADAGTLDVRTTLNGETVQSSNTRELIFKPADVVAFCSRFFTLKPGDLIFTGTPGGVGVFRKPPLFLKAGDEVVCTIGGLGSVRNRVQRDADEQAVPKRARL